MFLDNALSAVQYIYTNHLYIKLVLGNVLSVVQYMYTNHLNIQACDAALGFSALGILIAIKVAQYRPFFKYCFLPIISDYLQDFIPKYFDKLFKILYIEFWISKIPI